MNKRLIHRAMTRFLIGTIAAAGHVNPAVPIVGRLVERGHEVWWYTGRGWKQKVVMTGARHIPIGRAMVARKNRLTMGGV